MASAAEVLPGWANQSRARKQADHLSGGTTVEREQMLQRIAEARALLGEVIEGTDLPMIERTVKLADMNLHWAQWNLGEPVTLMPEME